MHSCVSLITVLFLCGVTSAQFRIPSWPTRLSGKRDCQWSSWTSDGRCTHVTKGIYRVMKKRSKIPARNGGRDCRGSTVATKKTCTETQIVASTFVDSIFSKSRGPGRAIVSSFGGGNRALTTFRTRYTAPSNNPCTPDFRGKDGKLRMIGKPCQTRTRGRRNAEGFIEFVKVPLKERKTREKREFPPVLSIKHRDILFLLDESGSVGSTNFKKLLKMATALTNKFCGAISVGRDTTRIGVMSFDKESHFHLDFDRYFSKSQVISFMNRFVGYSTATQGATCMIDTLKTVLKSMFTSARGARVRDPKNTERVVVLFSDGCANCKNSKETPTMLKEMREKFEAQNIPFIVFFIGEKDTCVRNMDGLADGSRCYQIFRAKDWREFDGMISDVESRDCMDAWYIGPSCS